MMVDATSIPAVEYESEVVLICKSGDEPIAADEINLSETEDLVTVMWASEMLDKNRPDTFFEKV